MRRPDPHLPYEELAVGYALHALEPDDEQRFLTHLVTCGVCRRLLSEHADTLAQLAHVAPAAEPPPSLLEGIRAGIRADLEQDVARSDTGQPDAAAVAPSAVGHPVAPRSAVEPTSVRSLDAARRRRGSISVRRSHLLVSAAAVSALLLGLGGWNASLQRDVDQQLALSGRLAQTVQALESDSTRTVRLAGADGDVRAVAVVQGEQMSLVVDGLEPNSDDTTYVLWGQSGQGDVRAVGTFDVPSESLDVLHGMVLEDGIGELRTLMVTHEQGRTPPATTTQPVVVSGSV